MSSDARSAYDASNEVWPYFVLTILGVVLIPMSISQLIGMLGSSKQDKAISSEHSSFRAKKARKKQLSSPTFWILVVGWAFMAWLVAFVRSASGSTVVSAPNIWDPYEILNVGRSAGLREIRAKYRELSRELHPDKVRDFVESTKDEIEAAYVEISKAYRALTDDVTRENYLQYGHPDGPQPVTHGIALPVFLFNPVASATFIASYLLAFVVGVPLVVSKWPASQQRTRKDLLQATATQFAELLVKDQPHFINGERILKTVLLSPDMDEALRDAGASPETSTLAERRHILDAYLSRETPQTNTQLVVAAETARLILGLHDFAAEFRAFTLCKRLLEMRRAIVQAVPLTLIKDAEYLQLKGADLAKAESPSVTKESLIDTVTAARTYLPHLHLLSAELRVPGEATVTVNSRMYLALKFLVLPLGDSAPQFSPEEIEAADSVIDGVPRSTFEVQAGFRNPDVLNKKQPLLPPAVAPYFPESVQTVWYVYLYGEIDNKLVEKPLEVRNMDLHNLELSKEKVTDGDDVLIGTLYVPLSSTTPPEPSKIALKLAMLSGTYFGTDLRCSVSADVVPPSSLEAEDAGDSDDDEELEGLSDVDTSTEEEASDDEK